jgi:L-amino acid N-acyltransferase YncA
VTVVRLRDARLDDCERVWVWNGAPEVRAMSKDPRPIPFADHARWFRTRIEQRLPMWIVERDRTAVGVVRIESGKISIAIDGKARGRGTGRQAITLATHGWARPLVAEILKTNRASRAAFEACGFALASETDELVTYRWNP